MKILIMGLPGSGKTWFAQRLSGYLNAAWFNADAVRKMCNDWDFSETGRIRQSERMFHYATFESIRGRTVVSDFVCPTRKTRSIFDADLVIWMDTVNKSRYEDTNKIVEPLSIDESPKIIIKDHKRDHEIKQIADMIKRDNNIV